jgi:Na+/H+-dicarboxylate symporter
MRSLFRWYFRTSLVLRIFCAFLIGAGAGIALWLASSWAGRPYAEWVAPYVGPFGSVLVSMLKMIVVPVIFFSLIVGASSLPIRKFGRVGAKVVGWYLATSLLAAGLGVLLATALNPGAGTDLRRWETLAAVLGTQADELTSKAAGDGTFAALLLNLFRNPFEALAAGNFLPIIVFSILFGLAMRVRIESAPGARTAEALESLIALLTAAREAMFKLVDWILEYSPVGVLALSVVNFSLYGPAIVGPYVGVTLGVVGGILVMIFGVYPALLAAITRENPLVVLNRVKEAMLTAFITRSSAATLPVSIKVATEELRVRGELASFSLPLGATINMDGVCIHLPMFAVLAANMFGVELTAAHLALLVITTVLASIGAGGVPGGSLMLLFIILQSMGLGAQQVAVIVALALGINPILDMFETMNNITGDIVCTYAVAKNEGLLAPAAAEASAEPTS